MVTYCRMQAIHRPACVRDQAGRGAASARTAPAKHARWNALIKDHSEQESERPGDDECVRLGCGVNVVSRPIERLRLAIVEEGAQPRLKASFETSPQSTPLGITTDPAPGIALITRRRLPAAALPIRGCFLLAVAAALSLQSHRATVRRSCATDQASPGSAQAAIGYRRVAEHPVRRVARNG
jgi:hypothetical protein